MTQKAVVFGNEFFPAITIHGSDTAAEYLVVAESFKNINLMGNRGNDIFTVGYAFGGAATLKRVRGNLQLNGGEGDDFLFFRDTEASNLRITNRHVHKLSNAGRVMRALKTCGPS